MFVSRSAPLTFQALSEEDRKLWLDAMDGKEPVCAVLLLLRLLLTYTALSDSVTRTRMLTGGDGPLELFAAVRISDVT